MLSRVDEVVHRFAAACRLGDIAALRAVLDVTVVATCDGGGLVPAARGHGAADVTQLVAVLLCAQPDTELTVEAVNGRAGLALRRAGRAVAVVAVEAPDTKITALWIVLNPAKLNGWHRSQRASHSR